MSRLIAGRIGFSVNGGGSGGIFNFLTQYIFKKQDFWEKINIVGGTESTPGNGYKYHFFDGSGPLVVYNGGSVEYIIVAGGGGGGEGNGAFTDTAGAGGGAGGYRTGTVRLFEGQYHVIIGSGGFPSSPTSAPFTNIKGNGSPSLLRYIGNISEPSSSVFIDIESTGGGAGGYHPGGTTGRSGGSGGGGAPPGGTGGAGNTPTTSPSQGNPGGTGIAFAAGGGGGSGGSGVGGSNPPAKGGNGGLGIAGFNADSGIPPSYGATGPSPGRWFAGGGGGGGSTTVGFGGVGPGAGPGPFAGGGPGGRPSVTAAIRNGTAGAVNTGGGGGGGAASPVGGTGGSGGSGIVIIRYLI